MLAPKLVASGRHNNIKLITHCQIEEVNGEWGNFNVKIRKFARFIDPLKCTGCGECEGVCPVSVRSEFEEGLTTRHAIYRMYPQAMPAAFAIEKKGISPCKNACPAGVPAQGYVALISQSKFKEALKTIRDTLPFPSVCGRVCHHPCENECNRKDVDESVSIRLLKRFASDYIKASGEEKPEELKPTKEDRVAIVGAGPAGLTCALRLLQKGYPVTVFDASDKPGGMLTSCLPDYRLPVEAAEYDINRVLAHGLELKTNTRIGKDITLQDLRKEYKAVFVAIGAQSPAKLPVKGADSKGVLYGLDFLRCAKKGEKSDGSGLRVAVIGGGNVAIDCAKSALRLGATEVNVVCLETRDLNSKDRMPAHEWEIEEAEEEGIAIHGYLGPKEILSRNGTVTALATRVCTSVYDEKRKFSPIFSGADGPAFEADTVIIAIGQRADVTGFEEIEKTPAGIIKADPVTLQTNTPGVFAGGDIVRGPASVIEAVAHGNEAAISIDRYLSGIDIRESREAKRDVVPLPEGKIDKVPRAEVQKQPASERAKDFREVEQGFDEQVAVNEAKRCLNCAVCSECLQCVEACKAEAVIHNDVPETTEINVGSVILSPGFDEFRPEALLEYGYGRFPNVIKSIEFERILSAGGPFQGKVLRPSDRKPPKKLAFIQCVGSRDNQHNYCSSICCMYATKEAVVAKEYEKDLDCTIFFMDLRAFGKGFDAYCEKAKERGVKYVRCRPAEIEEDPKTNNLTIKYFDGAGKKLQDEFDMVVLSVGVVPSEGCADLADKFGIRLNKFGFAQSGASISERFNPIRSTREGIFVCGAFAEPKDIPETVMEASAAAASAMGLLAEARGTLVTKKEYPQEKDVLNKPARIGVFVCHCGKNIAGVIDVPALVEYVKTLPDVVFATDNLYTCSSDTQKSIIKAIEENDLTRVVVASCTPRTHEPIFRDTVRTGGLNPYLFEMANIRDQCSWVHQNEPGKATEKAKALVRMAVAKARLLEPLKPGIVPVTQKALVIGGGMAGMTAALQIADFGYETYLVEKEAQLGGNLRNIHFLLNGDAPQQILQGALARVKSHPKVKVYTRARIKSIEGSIGNFRTRIGYDGKEEDLSHGVVIVAVGAKESKPQEYSYGENERIMTQKEFEKKISGNGFRADSVVMIQCVGSREEKRNYCSRVCCQSAIKNALLVKERNPQANVAILYRDIRTYGFKEEFYTKAREKGIKFIIYDVGRKPVVSVHNGKLGVKVFEPILEREIDLRCDHLVLSSAVEPNEDAQEIAKMLKVPLTSDGFFLEAHMKLRPVDFSTDGIFLCGLAHSPKTLTESVAQALAAASRAATILSKEYLETEPTISEVLDENCDGCAYCIDPCAFKALTLIEYMKNGDAKKTVERNESLCKGCGVCMATCPKKGIYVRNFKLEQIGAMMEAALQR